MQIAMWFFNTPFNAFKPFHAHYFIWNNMDLANLLIRTKKKYIDKLLNM
jgi:hypothetical protein